MKRSLLAAAVVVLVLAGSTYLGLTLFPGAPTRTEQVHLNLVRTIGLPGEGTRFDHMDLDLKHNRLYLADVADGTLDIVDLASANVTVLGGFRQPHGVLYLPASDLVYVTSGDGSVDLLNGTTLRIVKSISFPTDADNIRFDTARGLVFVAFGQGPGGGIAVINASTAAVLGSVILGGHPEAFEISVSLGEVFVNFPLTGSVITIDESTRAITGSLSLSNVLNNFPMALDSSDGRLFLATWYPSELLVFNVPPSKLVATVSIPGDADDMFYDSATRTVLVSCGQGSVQLVAQSSPDSYAKAGNLTTRPGARTSLFSPTLREFFVVLPGTSSAKAELRIYSLGKSSGAAEILPGLDAPMSVIGPAVAMLTWSPADQTGSASISPPALGIRGLGLGAEGRANAGLPDALPNQEES